jgi:anti-sigma28 factor (negative regulator of flagellin synthesis)
MFDINAVEKAAREELAKERAEKAKSALKRQMQVVELAKQVVANEERKLADIKTAIADGNV